MAVNKHPTGGFRAYKKIFGVEYQLYSFDENHARKLQEELNIRSDIAKSLKGTKLFSRCGRLVGLRVRMYKKTNKPMFQLQYSVNGKQKKIERMCKQSFETMWKLFLGLWRESLNLSVRDTIECKEQMTKALNFKSLILYPANLATS